MPPGTAVARGGGAGAGRGAADDQAIGRSARDEGAFDEVRRRPDASVGRVDAAAEWRRPLTGLALGLILFETISGLTIYLLTFSVFNQFAVLLHTVVGVLMTVPVGWYLVRHWRQRYRGNFNHYQLLGYVSALAMLVVAGSGFVLTWQAIFGPRIGRAWDLVHIVVGFVLMGALGAHLVTLVWRRSNNRVVRQDLRRAQGTCLAHSLAWGGCLTVVCMWAAMVGRGWLFPPDGAVADAALPAGYSFKLGVDRPFAPSLARKDMTDVEAQLKARILAELNPEQAEVFLAHYRSDPIGHVGIVTVAERQTASMQLGPGQRARIAVALSEARAAFEHCGAIPAGGLAGSAGCGTSGCHSDIYAEWLPSAHRYASMDFVFQRVQANMARELAPEATRYCAGCHDPIALFSGAKNVGNLTLSAEGADEGISCLVCHSTVQADVRGNGDYTVAPARRYLFETSGGRAGKFISDFLIRAYPRHHVASYSRPLYKTAEACAACHKQFVDEEVNRYGWTQSQNQYDSWRKSRWHVEGDDARTIGCRECHMPLVSGAEPASGDPHDRNRSPDDGKHRSHRFLGANQFIPRHMGLEGAEEQSAQTVAWLRGEYPIPEIADRWTDGPVVRLGLRVPEAVRPGESVAIQTLITNNKTGHDFPTGPLDMIEAWVEVTATDATGNIVFASARPDERGYLVDPQIVFKVELIDRFGELIGKHELWKMVGARSKRMLFPGFTDTTTFRFECPALPTQPAGSGAGGGHSTEERHQFALPDGVVGDEIRVTAKLWYCKFSAAFLDRLFGESADLRSEVTEIARAEAVIRVGRPLSGDEDYDGIGSAE